MIRYRSALGAVVVLAASLLGTLSAGPAAASRPAQPEEIGIQACAPWLDYAHGRGRAHASCPGFWVTVRVYCANDSQFNSRPYWREDYNKAECPAGIGAIGMTHATMH